MQFIPPKGVDGDGAPWGKTVYSRESVTPNLQIVDRNHGVAGRETCAFRRGAREYKFDGR